MCRNSMRRKRHLNNSNITGNFNPLLFEIILLPKRDRAYLLETFITTKDHFSLAEIKMRVYRICPFGKLVISYSFCRIVTLRITKS